jgi:HD-like signal output (HDOD) protein/ActR/RegA family two-component response regulator
MKRILFVEDNAILLQMYALMLDRDWDHWEVATAADAQKALEVMEQSEFDVVVSDMRMPGMSGVELLGEVRKRHPQTSRIIISGVGDHEEVACSLGATHQFLAKPFTVKTLKATLTRINGLDAYLEDANLKALVGQLDTLPSFPSLYLEVMKELDSQNSAIGDIAKIVAKDPSMTAKMLQVANSAAMGLAHKIHDPFEAVQQLGMNTVRSLALSAHVFSSYERTNLKGFSINELWDHSIQTGMIARMIMGLEWAETADSEDACTAGMLHDIGKLMLASGRPKEFQRALNLAAERNVPMHEVELEIFGATHAGIAAYLLGLWGLPAPIVEAVAFHHTPAEAELQEFTPLTAVHVANVLGHKPASLGTSGLSPTVDLNYISTIGMQNRLEMWRAEAVNVVLAKTE